jgi:hypothetical protein
MRVHNFLLSICMYDEIEARQLCIRALNQFMQAAEGSISNQEKADADKMLAQLKGGRVRRIYAASYCAARWPPISRASSQLRAL